MTALLKVQNLSKSFPTRSEMFGRKFSTVPAVDRVNFELMPGETLGLVGESGCGKTTLGRLIMRLIEPDQGKIIFDGIELTEIKGAQLRKVRPKLQMIFQDPYASLNPRLMISDLVGEGLLEHGLVKGLAAKEERVVQLLGLVGLPSELLHRYPHEFSGGQRQRIAIARAISLNPELIVCDEAVSALDVSVQAQILNLLMDLGKKLQMAYLFIAHDLAVVKHISQRVAVMYLGQLVEFGTTEELFSAPAHPYTQALLGSVLVPDPKQRGTRLLLQGEVGHLLENHQGCRFAPRCPKVRSICREQEPPVQELSESHWARCVL